MPGSKEGGEKAKQTQLDKYGDGYHEEMARRAKLRKTHGYYNHFGYLKENDPERLRQIIKEREAKRNARKEIQE